jgi:hypothetical protein
MTHKNQTRAKLKDARTSLRQTDKNPRPTLPAFSMFEVLP